MTDLEIMTLLCNVIANYEMFKSSIKRSPRTNAEKRAFEKRYRIPEHHFEYCGHKYSVEYVIDCSGYTIFAHGYYYKDGEKTTLTTLKNIHKQLAAKGVLII